MTYDSLPESIKHAMSPHEFAWLSDRQRNTLLSDFCEPPTYDD